MIFRLAETNDLPQLTKKKLIMILYCIVLYELEFEMKKHNIVMSLYVMF